MAPKTVAFTSSATPAHKSRATPDSSDREHKPGPPTLPLADLVGLARGAADDDQRRRRLGGLELTPDRPFDGDRAAGGHVHLLAVERRQRSAALDDVQLLLARLAVLVLGDEDVAGVLRHAR